MKKKINKRDLTERNAKAYNKRLKALESVVKELSEVIGHKKGDWYDFQIKKEVDALLSKVRLLEVEKEEEKGQLKKIMTYFQTYFIKRKK